MIPLDLLLKATEAVHLAAGTRHSFPGFAHDSRMVGPGDCFVAVGGTHRNGHEFLLDAVERGAGALLVEQDKFETTLATFPDLAERLAHSGIAVLAVENTRAALRKYARAVLAEWRPTVVAVTGSTGKTTTKEAIANVLSLRAPTFRSYRNYNDALGLPLALGRLEPMHHYAVCELAADHPGEIAELAEITRPRIGVVTNVSPTHLQYFGTVTALADELSSLPAALPPDGTAILAADDPHTRAMAAATAARVLYFGTGAPPSAEPLPVRLVCAPLDPTAPRDPPALALASAERDTSDSGNAHVLFPHLFGEHWAGAILAALTVGVACGIGVEEALPALTSLRPLPGRLTWLSGVDGIVLLDDSHNATPASVVAGLATLTQVASARQAPRIAVLGDMLRLGPAEEEAHAEVGALAAQHCDYLVARGQRAERIAEAARQAGMARSRVVVTYTAEDAASAVRAFATAQHHDARGAAGTPPVVYIKGSEETRMEQVAAHLLADPALAEDVLDRQSSAWQRFVVMQPDRPTWIEVDLGAIGHNTRLIKDLVGPEVSVLISLKADAYGHGALPVARTALRNGASWLGVASLNEAAPLRAAGIEAPILIFGYIPAWQAREAVRLGLRVTLYDLDIARALSTAALDLGRIARVHLKVDTGMGRLGLRAEGVSTFVEFARAVRDLPGLEVEGLFTHFATADQRDQTYVRRQLERFEHVLRALEGTGLRPPLVHAANSAATLSLPEAWYDMVRPGIAIYGLSPSDEVSLPQAFRPALAFKTQVAEVKEIPAGEGIGYGATYVTSAPTRIAVLPVGYADGFRRAPRTWGEVLIRGQRAPLVGRVCMDQCMIDVSAIRGVRMGDEVVLIGRQGEQTLSADDVAARLGTISYEVVSEILARVPRMS